MPQPASLNIDLGLAALSKARHRLSSQTELSREDIADICGCHRRAIQKIEESALNKLHKRLGITADEINLFTRNT